MRIAVLGAGGVGGYFGGRLAEAGESVVFVCRGAHLDAIRREGLRIESAEGDAHIHPAEATADPREAGPVDVVLLGVKAWQVREAAEALRPMMGPATFVVPLQNGVEAADELGAELGPERVVPGLCRIVSYVAAPGRIRHGAVAPRVEFAEADGRSTPRVRALKAAFDRARGLKAEVSEDIAVALWEKLLFIAPFSGVGAVTRAPAGVLRAVPETRRMLEAAMQEVLDLALARGVGLRGDVVARTMRFVDEMAPDATTSMQRDVLDGRPSELEYQNGAVVRLGRRAGLPVPVNAFLYASLLPSELAARGATR